MATDRWREIERVYHEALERDAGERAAFLDAACAGDEALRAEVESLLGYQPSADVFLEQPALEVAARDLVSDARPSLAERRIGGYEVLSLLGEGGMGIVYRAKDLRLGREVALKVLPPAMAGDAGYLQRFEAEARLASVLNHPNIVTIYGVGDEGGVAFIAMELVQGRTLRERLAEGRVPIGPALDLAIQIADALAAAHASGIVHRDLKPENVMVTAERLVKVLDFGLARRQSGPLLAAHAEDNVPTLAGLTQAGTILGTVGYMSPEQAAGRPAGQASDQFSFGAILYEMLSGRRAFERNTAVETLSAIIREEPAAIRTLNAGVTAPLQQVVERCLAKKPADRYPNTRHLVVQLRQIRDRWDSAQVSTAPQILSAALPVPTSSPIAVAPAVGLTRRRALWIGGAVGVAAAAGLATWRLLPHGTGIRSLAVLPFTNVAKDEDAEYLCDGITESLIQRILPLPSLKVMGRSTVFNFKGKTVDPRDAGRQLGVDAILTGTVTRRPERVLISVELVEVATGARLWGNTYDRAAADILAIQDDIARAIVDDGIRLRLGNDERRQLARRPTDDPEAYDLYLRANHLSRRETEDAYLSARQLLQQAVTRDRKFALAYIWLGATYSLMAIDGFERPTDAWPQASRYARQALDLDPDLPDAHNNAASEAFFFKWDWAAAERTWKTAMQSRPGDFDPGHLLGPYALERWALGHPDEALQLTRKAREIDPLSPVFKVREGDFLFQTRQLDAAVSLYEQVIQDEPEDPRAYFGLAEVRRAQERFDEAIDWRRRGHAAAGDDSLRDVLATAHGAEGYRQIERSTAGQQLEALKSREAGAYVSPLDFARAYAQLGDKERAFGYFDTAFADRAPGLVFLKVDRAWDTIRDDPRFLKAVRRVGLPWP